MATVRAGLSLVAATAVDIQRLLSEGKLSSTELIQDCLHQIKQYDRQGPNLHAMISIAPTSKILERAQFLDQERKEGRLFSPLHGIPIILKDIINTLPKLELPTTAGAWAMAKSYNKSQSLLVEKLLKNGLIILGKTNLSEFGATKGPAGLAGLSGIGGQTQSAYVHGGVVKDEEYFGNSNPGGSSAGSAVGVAAGYSPISIGGEGDGSIQTPASRSALYALKCTPRSLSSEGIFLMAPTFESLGGMVKCVSDLIEITRVILQSAKTPVALNVNRSTTWASFTVGFVDLDLWRLPSDGFTVTEEYKAQVWDAYSGTMEKIRNRGGTVNYPVAIPHPSTIEINGSNAFLSICNGEMRISVDAYLQNQESSEVWSLADIIQFTKDHPELQAGIGQEWFIESQNDAQCAGEVEKNRRYVTRTAGLEGLFKVMDELKLDFICSCTDGPISTIAAMAGSPTANVPLGYLEPSKRPFGLTFVARPGEEAKLLEVMSVYEDSFPPRRLPTVVD